MSISEAQRGALHLYCKRLADAMNDAGYDMNAVFDIIHEQGVGIPWNMMRVKENLYKQILDKMTGKESTEDMSKVEPGDVYAVLDRWTSEHLGIHIEWPSEESLHENKR